MKSIFKLMTVALAAGLVVSCSDELNLEKQGYTAKKGDLVGSLYAPAPTRVAMLDVLTSEGYNPVWSTGDEVNVFSSTQLNFNQYKLVAGEGTPKGIFEPVETNPALLGATDLYAITEASYQYGVSAVDANSGKVKLTAEIPQAFDWEKLATANAYALPSPFWGHASFDDGGLLNVAFKPLTGLLRLDLSYLPEGVNGIVVVTGNTTTTGDGAFYTVVGKNPESGKIDFTQDAEGNYTYGKSYYGTGEGISGHFNTILDYKDVENYLPLHNDRALRCYDTLRVDFPEATKRFDDKVLFIPLIAQHYDNLKVIAVMADDVMPYVWGGEILRTFDDLTVANGECKDINMTASYLITETSPKAISEKIAKLYDGIHSLVVSVPSVVTSESDSIFYITSDNPDAVGQTSVTINFGTFTGEKGIAFVEASTDNKIGLSTHTFHEFDTTFTEYDPAKATSGNKERTVTLNFTAAPVKGVTVCLPTSNVVMSASINASTTTVQYMPEVNIIASNTENVSGYDATNKNQEDAQINNTVSNEQKAALKFTGQYSVVNYYSGGAVYFLDVPEVNAQQSEIKDSLIIYGQNPKSLRITDALIGVIDYPEINGNDQGNNITTYIFTTGSAAIKKLSEGGDKVKIQAYWTGKRLTPYSILNGYEWKDVKDDGVDNNANFSIAHGAIYTAAQLQGMGLSMQGWDYTISPRVESIWLGGIQFPWIGAQIKDHDAITLTDGALANAEKKSGASPADMQKIAKTFSLDGRNVTLKNMILDIYDPTIELPGCCGTTQKIRLLKNIGLIRCVLTKDSCDIKNIQLDDVYLNTGKYAIDNIGSLAGIIDAEKQVKIGGSIYEKAISSFTDIRIQSKGNNIGGIVGELESKGKVIIDSVEVESIEKNNSYIHGSHIIGKNNVGGLVGRITNDEAYIGKSNPAVGDVTEEDVAEQFTFYPITRINYTAGQWAKYKDNAAVNVGTDNPILGKWYIDPTTGDATQVKATTEVPDPDPVAGRQYFSDAACTDLVGTFKRYKDGGVEFWSNGKMYSSVSDMSMYEWAGSGTPATTDLIQTETDATDDNGKYDGNKFAKATQPYDWENTYYTTALTRPHSVKQTPKGGDYPTELTVIYAKVNLDNAAFDGETKGIIKAEQGSNAGGMVGFAKIDGNTEMEKDILVKVPTITATTTETRASLSAVIPTYGNNVGGLVGNYQNVGNSDGIQSKFAGTITAREGIIAESMRAGGVLGLQNTRMFTHNGTHDDPAQVLIGAGAEAKVTIGELTAENGLAGGLVGYQEGGKLEVASANNVTIAIDEINASHNAGGAIGQNNDDAILAVAGKTLTSTVGDMNITKDASYFPTTAYRNFCGTFGTLVGEKSHWLEIDKQGGGNVTAKVADATKLTDAKKDELLFGLNGSAATTEIVPNSYKFWGDDSGYLGHGGESSQYIVNGTPKNLGGNGVQQGNYDYNIFKTY